MPAIYRRHLATCEHADKGRGYHRCWCPPWVQGTPRGQRIRKALDLDGWEARGSFSGRIVPACQSLGARLRRDWLTMRVEDDDIRRLARA